jgi:hypothetical protein
MLRGRRLPASGSHYRGAGPRSSLRQSLAGAKHDFHQRGFCFQTARGRKEFDNRRCSANSVAELKLSEVEKANVATLEKAERSKSCQ